MTWACKSNCGDCCGIIHVPAPWWKRHRDKTCRDLERVEVIGSWVFPLTVDGHCAFLREDMTCNVYTCRPTICRKYGQDPGYPCPYLDLQGRPRGEEEALEMQEMINESVEQRMIQMGIVK